MFCGFESETAKKIGITAAVILNRIGYWQQYNESKGSNFHDGKFWTYNTLKSFCQQFPFWSLSTIARALKKLKEQGYIEIAEYNATSYDHTKWYTLTETGRMELKKSKNRYSQNDNIYTQNDNIDMCKKNKSTINKEIINTVINKELAPVLAEALNNYSDMRRQIKAPLTQRAIELILIKLEKLAPQNVTKQAEILDQSTVHTWRDVFPLQERRLSVNNRYISQSSQKIANDSNW